MIASIAFTLFFMRGIAYADPPVSSLTAIRLHVTTTSVRLDHTYSSTTVGGIVHKRVAIQPLDYVLPGKVLDGYVLRTNLDPSLTVSTATKPADLATDGRIFFYLESELVKIKYPRPALVSTNLQYVFLPISLVSKAEKRSGSHAGYSAYGEPFYMPAWQAALLSTKAPFFVCTPETERKEVDWVSYDENVGERELTDACGSTWPLEYPKPSFVESGRVFGVVYPAD